MSSLTLYSLTPQIQIIKPYCLYHRNTSKIWPFSLPPLTPPWSMPPSLAQSPNWAQFCPCPPSVSSQQCSQSDTIKLFKSHHVIPLLRCSFPSQNKSQNPFQNLHSCTWSALPWWCWPHLPLSSLAYLTVPQTHHTYPHTSRPLNLLSLPECSSCRNPNG